LNNEMTDPISPTIIGSIVGVCGFIAGIVGTSIRVTWQLAKVKEELIDKINKDTAEMREQLASDHGDVMKQFGDSLTAQSEKIRQTELWNRDNFVRRGDFDRAIDGLAARMEIGLAKIEAKIDKLQGIKT
jgi:hypothetical protein